MFPNKKSIIFLNKHVIKAAHVLGFKPKTVNPIELEWTSETLPSVLLTLKKHIGANVRILLADEFAYVVSVPVPVDTQNEKELIKKLATEIIPENLDETIWDFKEILLAQKKPQDPGIKIVQVVATPKKFFENLSIASIQAGLHVEAIEPLAYTLAHLTSSEKNPVLVVYLKDTPLLLVACQGLALLTKTVDTAVNPESVQALIDYSSQKFHITVTKVLFCGETNLVDVKEFVFENCETQIFNLDPMLGLALKKDLKGKDEKTLNLSILKIKSETTSIKAAENKVEFSLKIKKKTPKKYLFWIFPIIIVLLSGALIFKNKTQEPVADQQVIENFAKETTPTEEIKPSYSIHILNGSGKEGVASKLADLLQENNYQIDNTDNADNYDYEKTEIRTKSQVDTAYKESIKKILEDTYNVIEGEKLTDDAKADVIIIVGKQ